jgi:hypothetical protein
MISKMLKDGTRFMKYNRYTPFVVQELGMSECIGMSRKLLSSLNSIMTNSSSCEHKEQQILSPGNMSQNDGRIMAVLFSSVFPAYNSAAMVNPLCREQRHLLKHAPASCKVRGTKLTWFPDTVCIERHSYVRNCLNGGERIRGLVTNKLG